MTNASIWLLALGLATDAALVAAVIGSQAHSARQGPILAVATGFAQAAMPLIGAFAGGYATGLATWTKYIAAAVFCILAWRLATEQDDEDAAPPALTPLRYLIIAFATSIDALVAGATFPTLGFPPLSTSLLIGAVTFAACLIAFFAGAVLTEKFGRVVRYVGAALLLAVAAQSLI